MSDIGVQFSYAVNKKGGEPDANDFILDASLSARNVIYLRRKYNCNIYYHCSESPKMPWWGFSPKQISQLKQQKSGFVVVFLLSSEEGHIVIDKDIDEFSRELSIDKKGNYKVNERDLRSTIAPLFRSVDDFFERLSRYQRNE